MSSNFLKIYKGTTYAPQDTTPSNPVDGDIYYDSVLNKFRGYQNGSWQDLITDGADGINYILNPGAEAGVDGYVAYADAAATSPVDGIGGSPSFVTWARTTTASEILRQDASSKLTKSSGNAQGEGIAYDFSIDPRDKNAKLQISFDFKNLDSNYVNGDLKIFVYDVDNSTLIGNVVNDDTGDVLIAPDDGGSFYGEIFATDSLNYRLIFHVAGTTTANWDLSVDRIKVGPVQAFVAGSKANVIETKTLSSNITVSTTDIADLRFTGLEIGAAYDLRMQMSNLSAGPGQLSANHDGSYILQMSNKVSSVGSNDRWEQGNSIHFVATATSLTFDFSNFGDVNQLEGDGSTSQTFVQLEKRNDLKTNLVSNNQLNQTGLKVSAFEASGTVPDGTTTIAISEVRDTQKAYDGTTFTAPKAGFYFMTASTRFASNATGRRGININLTDADIGGISGNLLPATTTGTFNVLASGMVYMQEGGTASVSLFQDSGGNLGFSNATLSITALPDFSSYGVLNPKTEYLESVLVRTASGIPTSGTWDDMLELELTPGTWDLDLTSVWTKTSGASTASFGISDTPGNVDPGSQGVNKVEKGSIPTGAVSEGGSMTKGNVVVNSTTTYYAKFLRTNTNITTWGGKFSARKVK
jgi:hypothetical protein